MTTHFGLCDGILGPDQHISESDADAVLAYIGAVMPPNLSPHWTAGWPTEIEAALLDSVFSSRATYGGPDNGVRRVVSRWREHRSVQHTGEPLVLDDISALAAFAARPGELEEILGNRQRVGGNASSKAEAISAAAADFVGFGIVTADDARIAIDADDSVRTAFESIAGLGRVSWECFLIQLGVRTETTREILVEFVVDAILTDNPLTREGAHILLHGAAAHLSVSPAALEHAIWRFQHGRRSVQRASA